MSDWVNNLFGAAGQLGSVYGALDSADKVETMGNTMYNNLTELGNTANTGSQFNGYGVTSTLGNSTVGSDGSLNFGVGPQSGMQGMSMANYGGATGNFNSGSAMAQQYANNPFLQMAAGGMGTAQGMAMSNQGNPAYGQASGLIGQGAQNAAYNNAMAMINGGSMNPAYGQASNMLANNAQNAAYDQGMNSQNAALSGLAGHRDAATNAANTAMANSMQNTTAREQEIFDSAMAMQNPELDRAQAAQQAREYAMGRGGVRGSQYGGTAEDAAMARARAEAMNKASFAAMQQGQTELMNQGTLASNYGQLGQAASGMISGIGETMGSLGRDNAQLGQQAGQILGSLGNSNAQLSQQSGVYSGNLGNSNAQLAQGAGQYLGNLGYQNSQLGQNASQIYGDMASQLGSLGNNSAQTGQGAASILAQIGQGQGNLGSSLYEDSYLPMEMQKQLLQITGADADRAQTGQLTGLGYLTQMGLGASEVNVNSQNVANQLRANLYDSILDNVGGNSSEGGGSSGIVGLIQSILNQGG